MSCARALTIIRLNFFSLDAGSKTEKVFVEGFTENGTGWMYISIK
jgi:hypothetical protein